MRAYAAIVLGLWLALVALAVPAQADGPIPRSYPESGQRASTSKSAEKLAEEKAAADADDAACKGGKAAACTALGTAFKEGEGRPQNRPVAELLYRKACAAGHGEGCFNLSNLLGVADKETGQEAVAAFTIRACRLDMLEACDVEADALAWGSWGEPDQQAATALRRATCAKGRPESCRALAGVLMGPDGSAADLEEGLALIDRQCRLGDNRACAQAASYWQAQPAPEAAAQAVLYQELGCRAGDNWACRQRGNALLGPSRGEDAAARAAALIYFDRACARDEFSCRPAENLRQWPPLLARCEAGERAACRDFAALLTEPGSPLENLNRAVALLGTGCEAGANDMCLPAANAMIGLWNAGEAFDSARYEAYLVQGCAAEGATACERLADELSRGERIAQDLPRAAALYAPQCDEGREMACEFLEDQAKVDPASPLMLASKEFAPELTPEEEAEEARRRAEDARPETAKERAARCTTTKVKFDGRRYTDTICTTVVRIIGNGFKVRRGAAPWQALLWRPPLLNRQRLVPEQRVLCGGAVIREGWILTAAHCLTDEKGLSILYGGHEVRLGLINPLSDEGYSYPILRVEGHPDYDPNTFAFDIALVQYDTRAGKRGSEVLPIARIRTDPKPLGSRPIKTGDPAYTYGWGRTELVGGEKPDVLRGARLSLRDPASCTAVTRFGGRDVRRDSVLCADQAKGQRGGQACYGDSGGPLITYADPDKVPTIIGVVSAGEKCGTTGTASRYVRVAHPTVQAWLNRVLSPARAR
jgi:TPR repeat protein